MPTNSVNITPAPVKSDIITRLCGRLQRSSKVVNHCCNKHHRARKEAQVKTKCWKVEYANEQTRQIQAK